MASTFFTSFISLLLLHLGCFLFILNKTSTTPQTPSSNKPTKPSSFLKRIFSLFSSSPDPEIHPNPTPASPYSSTRSSVFSVIPNHAFDTPHSHSIPPPKSPLADDGEYSDQRVIFPCSICGELFQRSSNLEKHQSVKHAVSELAHGESGNTIVSIIFNSGWTNHTKAPVIHRILKILNSPRVLNRFEEYRECVKSKAARSSGVRRRRDERCVADGNELLRFHCSTFMCELGQNGNSSICSQQYCSVCGIIRSGFSAKLDGISTLSTSWRGHVAIPEEMEEEFSVMNVKRAMLVCRVIAGRVGCEMDDADKRDSVYDSLAGRVDGFEEKEMEGGDELLVYNPRAVLPCFVIVYTV